MNESFITMSSPASLPRIGLGMAALGRPGYINLDRYITFGSDHSQRTVDRMQTQSNLVLDRLFQLCSTLHQSNADNNLSGNNCSSLPWIDCARSYGLSERFVGEYLRSRHISPNDVYVSSKWGYAYVANFAVTLPGTAPHEIKDHSVEQFLKQVKETDSFLGEYINLYQIHSATFESGVLENVQVHHALDQCRRERGWKIGLSVSSPQQDQIIRAAMKIRVDDRPLFDSVQCTYNLLEQRPGPALQEAHNMGMDIIIKEGLANGRILRQSAVIRYSEQLACQPDQLALAVILAQPFQPRVLSGAVTPEQLESNFQVASVQEKLQANPSLLKEIMEACVVPSEEYWAERAALEWN